MISVVIPVFNAAAQLGACLDALLQQNMPASEFEIIVVDNASTDGSAAAARRRSGVRLLSEPRRGAYAARNRGIRAARGELIAFTDADCVPDINWLRSLKAGLLEQPGTLVVMGRDVPTGRSRAIRLLGSYDHYKEIFVMASDDPGIYYGHTNCMMTRRQLLEQVGLFDERPRGADVIFVHQVLGRYGTTAVQYYPDALVNHMEVRSAAVYFKKAFIYGRSARSYSRAVPARPLRNRERLSVFRSVVRGCELPALEQVQLFCLLVIGVAAYALGWLSLMYPHESPDNPDSVPETSHDL